MNKVFLVGNLVTDVEIRTLQNGDRVANMTVATSPVTTPQSWKDRNSNRQEETQFHYIVVRSERLIDVIKNYLKKGHKVSIIGELKYLHWKNTDGMELTTAEIVLTDFSGKIELLSPAPNGEKTSANNNQPARSSQTDNNAAGGNKSDFYSEWDD